MNRRTLLSTLAGFFVGKKVVAQEIEFTPISRPPDTQTIAWLNQMYANLQKDYSTVWVDRPPPPGTDCAWNGQEWVGVGLGEHAGPEGPSGPVGIPGPPGNMGIESWTEEERMAFMWDDRPASDFYRPKGKKVVSSTETAE